MVVKVQRGDKWVLKFTFKDSTGTVINLTAEGWTKATLTVRDVDTLTSAADSDEILRDHDTSLTDPTNGIHTFTILRAATAGVAVGNYVADIQLEDAGGETGSSQLFDFIVQQDSTKDIGA